MLTTWIFRISAITFLLALSACKTAPERISCAQRDWYESGRHDGAQGSTLDRLAKYKVECSADFNSAWESVYLNGRNAGLVEYCQPENGYELGRMGISYAYVCPSVGEEKFLASYRRGQDARELQIRNQMLDAKIDSILGKLNRIDTGYEQRELASELEVLKKKRAQNGKELDQITK